MSSVSSLNSLLSSATSAATSTSVDLSSLLAAATGATSTGIDVSSAVSAAIYAAQAPERQWQSQQATVKSQIAALTSVQTALAKLPADLDSFNSFSGPLSARSVTSSASSAVSATAANGASLGSHSVSVSHLATAASWYSPSVPNSSAPLGSMQMQISGGDGSTQTFTIGDGVNSLSALANAINGGNAGVTASVVTDANGSRLALVGTDTGAAKDFSVSFAPVSGSSWVSTAVGGSSTPLAAGSFQVGDGGQTSTIAVSAGATLADVVNQINSTGLNVTASVTTDAAGTHLSLAANGGGTLSVTGDPAFALTRASQGSNALLTVDGIPVSSASNTVSGVVSGLTLNLLGTTTAGSSASLSVAADQSQIASTISSFVTDYNAALSLVNSQFTYSSSGGSQGVLSGDSTVRALQSALMSVVSYTASNTSGNSSGRTSLSSLGITVSDDGSLALDSAKLNQAITANASTAQNFFEGTALNGFAQSFKTSIKAFTSPANGALATSIASLNSTYSSLQKQVDDYESGYIASQRTVLTAMYSKAEIALQSLPATLKQLQAQLGNNSGS